MKKRNYPVERKLAPIWECPLCFKTMSARGKIGHMERVHGKGLPLKEHNPLFFDRRLIVPKSRPLARADVRKLIDNINYLFLNYINSKSIVLKRKGMQHSEYIFRQFEILFNCTPGEAIDKFPELKSELLKLSIGAPQK